MIIMLFKALGGLYMEVSSGTIKTTYFDSETFYYGGNKETRII